MVQKTAIFLFLTTFIAAASTFAASEMSAYDLLTRRVTSAGGLQQAQKQAASENSKLVEHCTPCHGVDGNKTDLDLGLPIPNLAEQQPLYLLKQMMLFASNKRRQPSMHSISGELNDDQFVTLSLYFSAMPLKPFQKNESETDVQSGKKIYAQLCVHCHGKDAAGEAAIPRLHGQNPNYIIDNMMRFRDKRSIRTHGPMSAITYSLKDEEIKAVAAYLVTLRQNPGQQ
jgi:cytochrome c553